MNPMQDEEHIERALYNLEAARYNMDSGFFEVALNRCYYAAFEPACVALRTPGFPVPKIHR